jgi:Fe-S cluster assembly iron-binding protein IscA
MEIISITERALNAIREYRQQLHIDAEQPLRVGIRQKNETNKRLLIGFDDPATGDKEMEISGMRVIYSPGEIFFFAGMTIDYLEESGRKGFTFVDSRSVQQ